jgi:hypothetical protein
MNWSSGPPAWAPSPEPSTSFDDAPPVAARRIGLPGPDASEEAELQAVLAGVLAGAGRDLDRARDPLEVEVWASQVWGLTFGRSLVDADIEEVIGGGLIRAASNQPNATSLAVLRALAAVAPEPYGNEAALAAEALAAAGLPEPRWGRSIGAWRPRAAMMNLDPVDDDGVTVFVEFTGRAGPHTIAVYIDHNLMHAKDMFVGPSLGRIRKSLAGEAGRDIVAVDISLTEAAERIRAGLAATARYLDPVVSDDFGPTRALVLARCRLLPDDAVELPERDAPDEEEWLQLDQRFLDSPEGAGLPRSAAVDDVLFHVHQWTANSVEGDPLRFSPVMVELFCMDYVPRKMVDPEAIEQVPAVLRAWIRFLADERGIPDGRRDHALAAVDRWSGQMVQIATDPSTWGLAKTMVAGLEAAGVDVHDADAMQAYVDDINRRGGIDAVAADLGLAGGDVIAFPGGAHPVDEEWDDEEDDGLIAAVEAEQRLAARFLRDALGEFVGAPAPGEQLAAAAASLRDLFRRRTRLAKALRTGAGFKRLPADNSELVLRAAAALIVMVDDPGLPIEDQSAVMSLGSVDLVPMAVAAARMGPGTIIDEEWCVATVRLADALLPGAIDGEALDPDDQYLVEAGFAVLLPGWHLCGLIDEGDRLTDLGTWAMPRMLARAWGVDFDSGERL